MPEPNALIWLRAQVMSKTLAIALVVFSISCLAQPAVPTRRTTPEDVVQGSIRMFQQSTNKFLVRWTYTEAGAKKMLAFAETHEGQKTRTAVGSFMSPPGESMFRPMPPYFTNYAQWKEGWLKERTDKVFGISEEDAKKIVAGLTSK